MSWRVKITAAVLLLAGIASVGALLALSPTASTTKTSSGVVAAARPMPTAHAAASTDSGSPRERLTTAQVERAFARSYASYLDGAIPASGLAYVSVTARAQVRSGGQIPSAFRDGRLVVATASQQAATLYSAQATMKASNRSESYLFSVQLLRERQGWQVAQVQPADISVDDRTRPASGPEIPAVGQRAARRLAIAYVDYRSGADRRLPAMTPTAAGELRAGADSLATVRIPRGSASLRGVRFGPLHGQEFAATASAGLAGRRVTFTFLMSHTSTHGWECDAFL